MPLPRDHSCVEHARFKQADWVETHGLDCGPYERGTDEWWECSICHGKYTQSELDQIAKQESEEAEAIYAEADEAEGIREVQGYAEAEEDCLCCDECPECTCHLSEEERVIAESERESDEATRRANAAFEARYCGGDGWTGEE